MWEAMDAEVKSDYGKENFDQALQHQLSACRSGVRLCFCDEVKRNGAKEVYIFFWIMASFFVISDIRLVISVTVRNSVAFKIPASSFLTSPWLLLECCCWYTLKEIVTFGITSWKELGFLRTIALSDSSNCTTSLDCHIWRFGCSWRTTVQWSERWRRHWRILILCLDTSRWISIGGSAAS